ncbi:hypothetical protein AK830_g7794 [Neonectria ditissima]|uniref:Uncharacterized protein n=1 Tax=Neonectria ditissima TaxID=78410 RepID=A0A0N8H6E8_9HYPO|nr:hypothetical protein AK830_g7794 [Neonectria ditissima]
MSQPQSPAHDEVFAAVFPYQNDQAHTLVNWGSGTMASVYQRIHAWLLPVTVQQMAHRTFTLALNGELEALLDEVENGANLSPTDPRVYASQLRNVKTMASQLWVAVKREEAYIRFESNLQKIELASLMARYNFDLYKDRDFFRQSTVSLSPYLGHIYSEVRKETATYEIWKHQVNHGDPSRVSQVPPSRVWNQALAAVVYHARDTLACEDCPDPLPFESIMRILEHGESWHLNFASPGTFISADMFENLDDDQAAAILVQDLWTVEIRYKFLWIYGWSEIDLMRVLINAHMEHSYHRALVSASGKMLAAWVKDGTPRGRRIDNDSPVVGFMQFGVPEARIVDGKVEEVSQVYTDFDNTRSHVEVSRVRNEYVVMWDEDAEELPPNYGARPPTYQATNSAATSS